MFGHGEFIIFIIIAVALLLIGYQLAPMIMR